MRITFNIEESVAKKFLTFVPNRQRSRLVTSMIARILDKGKNEIIRACKKANQDGVTRKVIGDWQAFDEPADGEWK